MTNINRPLLDWKWGGLAPQSDSCTYLFKESMALFWACDLVCVKSYVVLLLFALFKLCGAACLFLTADHICGPVLTRTQVHLPASSSFAPERVQRSKASAWSAAASPGVQNMCQHCCQALFLNRHFYTIYAIFTWFYAILRDFCAILHDFYTILRNFCNICMIFCQAQIFCCQAPKTILHPWTSGTFSVKWIGICN